MNNKSLSRLTFAVAAAAGAAGLLALGSRASAKGPELKILRSSCSSRTATMWDPKDSLDLTCYGDEFAVGLRKSYGEKPAWFEIQCCKLTVAE